MQRRRIASPPVAVRETWGIDTLKPMDGGQGTAFVGGGLVLEPVLDPHQLDWLAPILHGLPLVDHLRIVRPRPSGDGRWAVEGWSAWDYMEGEVDPARWQDALSVSDRFHDVVYEIAWSPAIRGFHPWARGDAFAWGEVEIAFPDRYRPLVSRLTEARETVEGLTNQVVHGDLAGNVLFHPQLPPAVIDVSPYWRPKRYADAIIVADAIAWASADLRALDVLRDAVGRQMMCRAILFRLGAAAILFDGDDERVAAEAAAYEPIAQSLGTV